MVMESFYLAAVEEADYAVRRLRLRLVVRHHDYGAPILTVEGVENVHDLLSHLGVEVSRRLVGEDNLRVAHNSSCNSHALALTARQLAGEMLHAVAKAESCQHLAHAAVTLPGGHTAAVGEWQ